MTRACLAAVLLVAASASTSFAGTYVGIGVGSSVDVGGQMSQYGGGFSGDGTRSGRLILGQRFGRLSVEGNVMRFGVLFDGRGPDDVTTVAAAAKLSFPVEPNIEAFGRAGVERSWLSGAGQMPDLSGDGYLLGLGFEYRLDLGIGAGSVFVDYARTSTTFEDSESHKLDGSVSMWTLGLTVSL